MPSSKSVPIITDTGTYSAPTLTIYGDVRSLTASGSGAVAEGASPGNPGVCTPQATRKPCP